MRCVNLKGIEFSEKLPKKGTGILCFYNYNFVEISGWENFDLRNIINERDDEWLKEIDTWHLNLSHSALKISKWWPLSAGSRLHIWISDTEVSFKVLFNVLALYELKKRNPNKIIMVVGAPKEIQLYFLERAQVSRKISEIFANINYFKRLFIRLTCLTISLAKNKKNIPKMADVLINSLTLNLNTLQANKDHFFGSLFLNFHDYDRKKIAWFYSDHLTSYNKQRKASNRSKKKINFFAGDFLDLKILYKSLLNTLKTRKLLTNLYHNKTQLIIEDLNLGLFEDKFIKNLIVNSLMLDEFVHYEIWRRVLNEVTPKLIVYPYEEKTMERAMQFAIQDTGSNAVSIGFAHAAYSKGHLYLRGYENKDIPKPNLIAVTGVIAKNQFIKLGYPAEKLVVIGSPRHQKLIENDFSPLVNNRKKLLLLIGHGFELINFSNFLLHHKGMLNNYELFIRRYPYGWIKEQNIAEKRLNKLGVRYARANDALVEEIKKADIILYDSTSAGIEAVLSGKIVIQLNLAQTLESNHLYDENVNGIFKKCQNVEELILSLNYYSLLGPVDYRSALHDQRIICENLFSPIDQKKLEEILTINSV
jgi:hypothetical protein